MSKLDKLLRELCPEGVEYKTLGEIGKFYGGLTGKSKKDFEDGNEVFITYKNVYSNPALDIYPNDKVKIADGEKQRTLEYGDIVFTGSSETPDECGFSSVVTREPDRKLYLNSFCFFFRLDNPKVLLPDFSKHLFRSSELRFQIGKTASGVTRYNVSKDKMAKVEIPLPPLGIQCEIVRILDNFTNLTAELTAELTARKKQYDFYRDRLLERKTTKVNFCTVENICEISRGKVISKDFIKENYGEYPVYSSQTENNGVLGWISTFDYDGEYLTWTTDGANAGTVFYRKGRFNITNVCGLLKPKNSEINIRYLYFALKLVAKKYVVQGMGNPKLMSNVMGKIKILVPPLDVQKRIVNVLDNFEKICSDLNIGLPAEIEARQKQYEYYRDKLLTFAETGNTILSRAEQSRAEQSRAEQSRALIKLVQYVYGCVWLELGDVIVSLNTGLNPRKFFKLNTEDATNYYITIREMKDGKIVPSEKTDRMNDEARKLCNNRSNLEVGDVLFSGTGTIGETAVIEKEPSNWNIKEGVYAIKPNQTMIKPMYLRYILMTDFIKKEYMKKAAGGTVQSVPMGELKKIRIPVPSLQEQNRITEVLKQLDDLCNDLTSGLPAEIEARQKQYEYYRDKLLTFKEVAAT